MNHSAECSSALEYIFFFEGPAWPVYCGWTFVVLFLAWRWGNGKTRDDTAGEQTDTLTQQQMKVATRFPAFVSLLSFNHKTQRFLTGSNLHTFQLVMSVHPFSSTVYPALRVAAGRAITSDHSVTPTPSRRVASPAFFVLCNTKFWSFLAGPWNSLMLRGNSSF